MLTYDHSPGPLKHDIECFGGLKVCKPLPVQQNKMESVEELRRALEAAQAETAALRAPAEGADRASRVNDTANADEADSAYRVSYDDGHAGRAADGHARSNARQGANTAIFSWGGVEIARSLNSQRKKMKLRCGACHLGPNWMAWVWGTRWITRVLMSLGRGINVI